MQKVLVAGATGYLGRHLVSELKKQGFWVRALCKSTKQNDLVAAADDIFIGQVTEPSTLHGITAGIDVVISAVGITRQKDGMTYMDVDYQGNANLLIEAERTSVKKFIYISAIDGDKNRHLKIFQAKERFVDLLKQSPITSTIVRPNGYFSDMSDFLNMAASGRIYLFGNGNIQINPISGGDLACCIVGLIADMPDEITVGGPDVLSLNEISQLAAKALGREVKITYLPDWFRRSAIALTRLFTTQKVYGPIEFFLTFMGTSHIGQSVGSERLCDFYIKEAGKMK